jgi:predicted amidohydrolase
MATKNLTIASLRFDVYENHISKPESRLAFVERCVRDICQQHHSSLPNKLLIITGPEYMFARKNYTQSDFNDPAFKAWDPMKAATVTKTGGELTYANTGADMEEGLAERRKVAYSEKEKKAIVDGLSSATSDHPNLLLAPGSIMWREYVYFKKLRAGIERLREGSLSPVYNTVPLLAGGETVHVYDKKNPSDEIKADVRLRGTAYGDQAERYRFVPGTASGAFQWKGIRFGIEICADHAGTKLRNELGAAGRVDIHLILSAGMMPTKNGNCAKAGGLMINNDGSLTDASQAVHRIEPTGVLKTIDPVASNTEWRAWATTLDI